MSKWVVSAKKADFNAIAEHFNIDPVVARVMRNRDLITMEDMEDFIGCDERSMHDPFLLNDMEAAVGILLAKVDEGRKIRVIGDYDVDGITSTYILLKGISSIGGIVDYAIPNRVTDGYGVNESLIEDAIKCGIDTIVTCDNGIAAVDAIKRAKEAGMTVILTDHHEVPYEEVGLGEEGSSIKDGRRYIYPDADVIINPKRHDSTYPFPYICGAMVAYKLMQAVSAKRPLDAEIMRELREMAGLGTVCDVMELKGENRVLVRLALKDMNDSRNYGIRALRKVCEIEDKEVSVYHLGFIIGPCLNATGRLDDASISIDLLKSESIRDAIVAATELKRLNDLRKTMTEQGTKEAFEYIEGNNLTNQKVLVIYLDKLHESLAGIVAGRVKERYYRPTFVITSTEDDGIVKGSGRSIEGFHMYDEMSKCKELFTKYGGHAMAAGVSMPVDNLQKFTQIINDNCQMTDEEMQEKVVIDVPMPMGYVSERLISDLEILEPFGTGNPKPVFAHKDAVVVSASVMGKNREIVKLIMSSEQGGRFEGIMFSGASRLREELAARYGEGRIDALFGTGSVNSLDGMESEPVRIDIIYYPSINEFRGRRSIQFVIKDYKC